MTNLDKLCNDIHECRAHYKIEPDKDDKTQIRYNYCLNILSGVFIIIAIIVNFL